MLEEGRASGDGSGRTEGRVQGLIMRFSINIMKLSKKMVVKKRKMNKQKFHRGTSYTIFIKNICLKLYAYDYKYILCTYSVDNKTYAVYV